MSKHFIALSLLCVLCLICSAAVLAEDELQLTTTSGENSEIMNVSLNDTVSLTVYASNVEGDLIFWWYKDGEPIENAASDTIVTEPVSHLTNYVCHATDDRGHEAVASYTLLVENGLTMVAVCDTNESVSPNESVVLSVNASCWEGDLHFSWESAEGEDGDYFTVENATSNELTAVPATLTRYRCMVEDDFGNWKEVYFYIRINNNLWVDYDGNAYPEVAPNAVVRLAVLAGCDYGELTYSWTKDGEVIDCDGPVLITDPVDEEQSYQCTVTDIYGNSITRDFYIYIDNRLVARSEGSHNRSVSLNSSETLRVIASCRNGSISYQWHRKSGTDDDYVVISGATEPSYTTDPVTEYQEYLCHVADEYNNCTDVLFFVEVDNHFTARANNNKTSIAVPPEEAATLKVIASCNTGTLSYQWFLGDTVIDETTDTFITEPVMGNYWSYYSCRVTDIYGASKTVDFEVYMDNQLRVIAEGNTTLSAVYGGSVTLAVNASCLKGGLHYQWLCEYNEIEGATASSYTVENVVHSTQYSCMVSDDYGSLNELYFNVHVDNGFHATAPKQVYKVAPHGSVTLAVEATANNGELTYMWDYNEDYNEPTFTLEDVTCSHWIVCSVEDIYGNSAWFEFEVNVENHLVVQAVGEEELTVHSGDTVVLRVVGSCDQGEIYYDWWVNNTESSYDALTVSDDGKTCTLTNVTGFIELFCDASDDFDNYSGPVFIIRLDNEFTAEAVGETVRFVSLGDEITLAVNASCSDGSISYQWMRGFWEDEFDGQIGPAFTFTVDKGGQYRCCVTHSSGEYLYVSFSIIVDEVQTLSLDTPVTVRHPSEYMYTVFNVTPARTGIYTLSSDGAGSSGASATLRDSTGKVFIDYSESHFADDFTLTHRLVAGQTYQYWVYSRETGTFTVTLTSGGSASGEEEICYTVCLRPGQTVTLPAPDGGYTDIDVDGTEIISVSGLTVAAVQNGDASVVLSGGSKTVAYDITVVSGYVLSMPSQLRTIEANAFAGDSSVRFVALGSSVTSVDAFAFMNTDLKQIVVPSANTEIAFSALSGTNALIICQPGSKAETFARENGFAFAYIN